MTKCTKTTIAKRESVNNYGVKIIDEVVKIETVCGKEFVWYETVGDYTHIFKSYKQEKKMREFMKKYGLA